MTISKKARGGVFLIAVLAMASGVQPAAAQNIFQLLFGGGQPANEGRSAYTPDVRRPTGISGGAMSQPAQRYGSGTLDPSDPQLRREMVRRRAAAKAKRVKHDLAVHERASPKSAVIVATPDAPRGSVAYFLKDKTLRAGDVVVTEKGFLVYQGGERSSRAFVAINASGSLKGNRSNLLALEAVSGMETPNLTVLTTPIVRDFVGPRLPDQMDERFAALAMKSTR